MQVGGPIDNIIIDSYKFIGREPTQEEIDELKNKYQGDTEKAMNDFYSVLKTYTNETPDLRKKVALKSYYKVPLNFAETMALSENTSLNPAEENRTTKAKGYFQIIERWHKDDIQNIYGKDFQTAMQDPSIQEDYMYKYLVPSYEKRIPNLKELFNQGYEKGVLDKYKPFMIGGRFTDDQLKAIQHVLGPTGAANLLTTGQTVDEGQRIDLERALSKMVSLRKQYGVPTSLSSQYDFDKFGIGDILPYDILAAGEDKVQETPAPKTVPYQQAPLAPGRKKVDLISPFLPGQEPPKKAEKKADEKAAPTPSKSDIIWKTESIESPKVIDLGLVEDQERLKKEKQDEVKIKKKDFIESTATLKELGNTYQNYKDRQVDTDNLSDEDIQARDEIQQVFEAYRKQYDASEFFLKQEYGESVTRDIQNVLANNAAYTDTLNTLEEKIKNKYQNNAPAKAEIAPLAEQKNQISEEVKNIRVQRDVLQSKQEELRQRLEQYRTDPEMTQARYDVIYANTKLEFDKLYQQDQELYAREIDLANNFDSITDQQNLLINQFNKEVTKLNSEYSNDPDVKALKSTYDKYTENWKKIENYRKSPYFDSYLNSISNISELNPTYKNLFPDKVRGEERAKELGKLAKDIVTEKKTDSYLLNEALLGLSDIYNGVKSIFTDAPAVGFTSTLINSVKSATFNLVGDLLGVASSVADLAGAEKLGRELRVGDLFGLTVTGLGIEQDVARGAIRSDVSGNPVEYFYTVREGDDQLKSVGLRPGDKVIIEDDKVVSYRGNDDFKKDLLMIPGVNTNDIVQNFIKDKKDKVDWDFSFTRTGVSAIPSVIDMLSLIGFNAAAIPRLSKYIAKKSLRTAAGVGLNFGAQTFQQYGDLYRSYFEQGQNPVKSAQFALGQSAGVALIEILNPLEMRVASLGGDAAVSKFRKVLDTTVDLYSRGKLGTRDAFNAVVTGAATVLKEIGKELPIEEFQGRFENQVENFAKNENKSYTLANTLNTGLTTIAVTGIPSYLMGRAANRTARVDVLNSAIYNATKDAPKFEADVLQAVNDGKMVISDQASIFNFVNYIKEELDTYDNLTDEQGAALSGLIGTRYSLENKKKNSNNEVVKKKIDEQIQEINTVIEGVASGNIKPEVDPFVRPLYEEEGDQPEADRVPTKKEFSDIVYATMPKEWQDMSKEEAWKSFQELTVQDQIKFFNTATGKKEEVTAPSPTAAGITKEQQAELDKVNKRAERIQRTLQEDTEVQEEGDEPLLTAEQKKKLETELQTLNQRRDAIQKQSTAAVPVQPGAEGRQGVGGQVQAEPEVTTREGEEAKAEGEAEEEVAAPALKDVKSTAEALKGKTEGLLTEPTTEQLAKEAKDKNLVTYNFDKEGDIPDAFKDKISSRGKVKGKEVIRVTLPKSMAEYLLAKDDPQAIAEAYHKAKKDGSNPALVEAVEGLLGAVPTPTPTTTEKVSQKAAEAPQKANTVQGVELTKADGTKTAPAEYRKNPNTGKWGRVNAKGGVTPVSSASQIKELEDALASQTKAAAETKKTEPTPAKVPNALKDVQSTTKALEGKDVSNLKIRNLDTEIEYNRGDDITSLKSAINNGLGEDRKLSRNEIEALSNLEFTIFPKQDVDRSNTDIPIIIIKKRGHSFENVQEALDYLQSQEADFTDNLSDYFEIVDGRHRVKKAIDNNLPLSTVLITEKDYEDFTNRQLFSDRNDTNNIEKILSDIGARNIEDGIEFLSKEKETTDILEKLNYLEEEKKFRDSNNANTPKSVIDRNIAEAYHKAKKDGSNPELVKAVEDLLGVAPSPTAAETKAPEAQTATAETVLEPIGKTSAEREKQIEKFFTAAAGKDKAESSQMAKLTNNIWNSVAKFFGARNAQTANQWIQSKVALIGKTTTTEAGKLGTPRFQNIPSLQDVESTTKALAPKLEDRQYRETGVKLRKLVGLIAHNGPSVITKLDSSKIRGSQRGRYGKGFYFSTLFKNYDYGDKSTFLNANELNLLNGNLSVANVLSSLNTPRYVQNQISKFEKLLESVKNNKDYNEISNEIKKLENIYSTFDKNAEYIQRVLDKIVKENPGIDFASVLESLELRVIEENNLNRLEAVEGLEDSMNNLLEQSGFDGVSVDGGRETLLIPNEKLNELLVPSQEQFISEAYHKARKDGTNPELVKAVEGLLAPGVQFQGDTDNPYTFAEAAEAVANNLITEIDRMIKERSNLANIKKRGFTKSQAAAQVRDLRKIKEDLLQAKKDPKWQVDAYHGTPYVFDKFSTEKIGTGEGAQAFGWGLYFTDLESIARSYAKEISQTKISEGIFSQEGEEFLKHAFLEGKTNLSLNDIKDLYYKKHPISKPLPKSEEKIIYGDDYDDIIKYRKLQEDTYEKRKNEIKEESEKIARPTLYKTSLFKGKKPGDYTFLEWDKEIGYLDREKINKQFEKENLPKEVSSSANKTMRLLGKETDFKTYRPNPIASTAENFYEGLVRYFVDKGEKTPQKEASLFLLRAGIDGIKYPAESIARGTTSDTARGFNYVIFDENNVTIEERVQFQQDAAKFRAAVITTAQNKLIVAALESPNASSFVHEGFHMFEGDLTAAEKQTIIDSYNDSFGEKETEFTTDVSEWGARMWEKYFSNGRQLTAAEVKDTKKRKALQEIFDNFTEWLKGVYEGVINYTNTKGVTKEVNIAPEVQALFDNIMGITTTPTPVAAETQVEAEAKTAEELSADIEADIEAAEAKEKMQTKNPTQIAGQELVNNPESAAGIPEDIAADLLDYVQGLKINIGGFKKIC